MTAGELTGREVEGLGSMKSQAALSHRASGVAFKYNNDVCNQSLL